MDRVGGREYWLTKMQEVVAALWDEVLTDEIHDDPVAEVLEIDNPRVKAEADEWKTTQGLANRNRGGITRADAPKGADLRPDSQMKIPK